MLLAIPELTVTLGIQASEAYGHGKGLDSTFTGSLEGIMERIPENRKTLGLALEAFVIESWYSEAGASPHIIRVKVLDSVHGVPSTPRFPSTLNSYPGETGFDYRRPTGLHETMQLRIG